MSVNCWRRPAGIYTTVFLMHDISVDQIKLLPLPEDTEKNNRTWLALITLELFLH